jgi:hypothetical protein
MVMVANGAPYAVASGLAFALSGLNSADAEDLGT